MHEFLFLSNWNGVIANRVMAQMNVRVKKRSQQNQNKYTRAKYEYFGKDVLLCITFFEICVRAFDGAWKKTTRKSYFTCTDCFTSHALLYQVFDMYGCVHTTTATDVALALYERRFRNKEIHTHNRRPFNVQRFEKKIRTFCGKSANNKCCVVHRYSIELMKTRVFTAWWVSSWNVNWPIVVSTGLFEFYHRPYGDLALESYTCHKCTAWCVVK